LCPRALFLALTRAQALYTGISVYTNEKLKQLILGLNEACAAGLAKTGRKQEYIERIRRALEAIKHAHDLPRWAKARQVLYQIKLSGTCVRAPPVPPVRAA
jgi:E3 SUMO-protein ligase PIAS1